MRKSVRGIGMCLSTQWANHRLNAPNEHLSVCVQNQILITIHYYEAIFSVKRIAADGMRILLGGQLNFSPITDDTDHFALCYMLHVSINWI